MSMSQTVVGSTDLFSGETARPDVASVVAASTVARLACDIAVPAVVF